MLGTDQVLNQGRYRIISSFDQDALGRLYEAYDTISNTTVVLRESIGITGKVASAGQVEAINAAFEGEAKALTEIHHESLVSVQDYFSEIDRQYLVLEHVTGHSVTKYLDGAETEFELATVLTWIHQVLGALHYLHSFTPPIIHRDVRPENIKLTSSQNVKLLTTKVRQGASNAAAPRATKDNAGYCYRPLEQIWPDLDQATQKGILGGYDEKAAGVLRRPLDPRSDIYSTGSTFYHVLTGTAPIDAVERSTVMLDGKPDPLASPADLNPNIPAEISDALMRAMSIRRENRFDWAVIMSQVLRTAVIRAKERGSEPTTSPKTPPKPTPKSTQETPTEIPMRPENESDFDHTSPEAQLQIRQQLAADRQSELEAEQAQLEEERNKIEQRRLDLEAEKMQHAAECERLRVEAEEAQQRAEQERKRLEKDRLQQEAEQERQKIAERLAVLEAERDRARVEEERLEKEAMDERQRAEQRLNELKAAQEIHRAEQGRIEREARKELERAEQLLSERSRSDIDDNERAHVERAAPRPGTAAEGREKVFTRAPGLSEEVEVPNFGVSSGSRWRVPAITATSLLIVGGLILWFAIPAADRPTPVSAVQTSAIVAPEMPRVAVEPSPVYEQPQITVQNGATGTTVTEPAAPAGEQKHPQISALPEKQKKPAAEKPVAAKKKVTVDDLINDN